MEKAREIMLEGRGEYYEPVLLDCFFQDSDELEKLMRQMRE